MVTVFLWADIGEILFFCRALILSDHVTGFAVPIVFQWTTTEIFQLVHRCRQTEAYTDTRNDHLVAFAHVLAARREGGGCSRFRYLDLFPIQMSWSEKCSYVHGAIGIDFISDDELVAGRQFIVSLHDSIAVYDFSGSACHVEVAA